MRHWLAVLIAVFVSSTAYAAVQEPAPNKALHALFEREFQLGLVESPESATFLGIDGFNDRVSDFSPQATARRKAHVKTAIDELRKFEAKRLSTQDRISREIMLDGLMRKDEENRIYGDLPFGADRNDDWMVASTMDGPQLAFPLIAKATPFRDLRDYENYLKRLAALPRAMSQLTARMEQGISSGWMPPRISMERVPGQFAALAGAEVTKTPFYAPFENFPAGISSADRERLAQAGRKILAEQVHPAYAAMQDFLEKRYLPASRADIAASDLPSGKAFYALKVRVNTTTDLTPSQIHAIGQHEVARIRAQMEKLEASTGFKGTHADFIQFLKTDPRFYFTRPEDLLTAYRDIAKRADAELPHLFFELPRVPYGIRLMEANEGDNAEHYTSGALDGSRAGYFEANGNNLKTRPKYVMEGTLLHEAVPGHHLQTARAQELKDLPRFRRASWYVAYGEGWALYAESLGDEMGMYRDPYSKFGQLSWEMVRACRLVIDTGIHALGWTREQGIDCLTGNAGLTRSYAEAEVDRYIVDPGQALGYKIGELKIKELRAKAQQALGVKFDLRRFHNAILDDGALPLNVLEARIDEWIAHERAAGK
jgi:uncharacterized protein (DUF885 family)